TIKGKAKIIERGRGQKNKQTCSENKTVLPVNKQTNDKLLNKQKSVHMAVQTNTRTINSSSETVDRTPFQSDTDLCQGHPLGESILWTSHAEGNNFLFKKQTSHLIHVKQVPLPIIDQGQQVILNPHVVPFEITCQVSLLYFLNKRIAGIAMLLNFNMNQPNFAVQ
ncbi:DNA mismatch repair protein MutL, partial [Striga asiatica]